MKHIIKTVLAIFTCYSALGQCSPSTSISQLQVNNVKANLNVDGTFWNDQATSTPGYEVPNGSGKHSIFSGALWVGGLDSLGQIRLAAQQYGSASGDEYWAGPIDNATFLAYDCASFDQIYTVTASEILSFITGGTATANINGWPARGNPNLGYLPNQDLAPFVDVNSDGLYVPLDGDYPKIKGDQAYWWVMNDVGGIHTVTNAAPFKIEIQVMAYAYATSNNINDMTFYDLKMIHKGTQTLHDSYFGLWLDADLGYYSDDYIGIDTSLLTAYVYNGDSFDEDGGGAFGYGADLPVQGVTFSNNPELNGSTPVELASFVGYGGGVFFSNPTTPNDYYSFLTGTPFGWPIVNPVNGDTTTFNYPSNPSDSLGWSECSTATPPGDRRILMSFGPVTMQPFDEITACFGAIYHETSTTDNCAGVDEFLDVVATLGDFCTFFPNVGVGLEEVNLEFGLYPNPASDEVMIKGINGQTQIQIMNSMGQLVVQETVNGESRISVESLSNGVYLVRLINENGSGVKKLIIE
ncbi:MAG: hypothetical protein ACI9J3_002926 [Parvicellaceae bacterium]|jgi:hypothetical protein